VENVKRLEKKSEERSGGESAAEVFETFPGEKREVNRGTFGFRQGRKKRRGGKEKKGEKKKNRD